MADGWIKIWRKIADSPMWLEEPFTKGQAWIDLLLLATASDHVSRYKGRNKTYKSGTVHFSLRYLATRWGWSRNKVYRFIDRLQKDGMIEYQSRTSNGTLSGTKNGTINETTFDTSLTIIKWALYQVEGKKNGTTNGTTDGTAIRTGNGTHPKKDIYPKNDISKEEGETAGTPPLTGRFPCGTGTKPEWMADERWEIVKYRTLDSVPDKDRGFYDSYIEYEEDHREDAP